MTGLSDSANGLWGSRTGLASSTSLSTPPGVLADVYSPSALFATNEIGTWYDPSDVANTNWRYNLLTYTEQFDNAVWVKTASTVTANTAVAPDGSTTADTIVDTAVNGGHSAYEAVSLTNGATYTLSAYVKNKDLGFCAIGLYDTVTRYATFNITTGVVGNSSGIVSSSIANAGNGWYRISITFTSSFSGTCYAYLYLLPSITFAGYTGTGAGIYVWGAQLNTGSTALPYQQITDPNVDAIAYFPKATLYQDSAGTTAVTAPAQSVGLMLDKSRGLVLWSELITNGDFSAGGTGWNLGSSTGFSFTGGALEASNANGYVGNVGTVTVGNWYTASITISNYTAGSISFAINAAGQGAIFSSNGTFRTIFYATSSDTVGVVRRLSNFSGTIDNISVRELLGNHATASGTTRPIYAIVPKTGRRNLLRYSQEFEVGGAWVVATTTPNAAVAPDGTMTADLITQQSLILPRQASSFTNGSAYSFSVYAKANTASSVTFYINGLIFGEDQNIVYDLANQTITKYTGTGDATITSVGSGWYRLTYSRAANQTASGYFAISNCSGVYLWGAQFENSSTATAYQKVVTQYEVTEAGVPSLSYLSFDGVDDFMVTGTITPGTDKAQVFAGLRKLSNASVAILTELSADLNSNAGSFYVTAPETTGASSDVRFKTRGSLNPSSVTSGAFPAPISLVLSGTGDISARQTALRLNGAQVAQSTENQGTGNFLAYPLYIGRRGGSTLPFNGNIYGLITRFGPNLSSSLITQTEQWLNTKTQAF